MIDLQLDTSLEEIQSLDCWKAGEKILFAESAGPSNMNLVLRIDTDQRSVILKQSKSFVRKFPQIPAPIERIQVEFEFLSILAEVDGLRSSIPGILYYDAENHMLMTEDLGKGSDFSSIYSGEKLLSSTDISTLVGFINTLHGLSPDSFPENLEMRKLNHEHIFNFPFEEKNGFDLDTIQVGLQNISLEYKRNQILKAKIQELGKRYLANGSTLLHGDFYPGSWLQVSSGIKIIDPEFGYLGDREFDLGVFLAHLDLGQQSDSLKNQILETYSHPLNSALVASYRGVEIMRRLIGIAQLPVNLTLSQKVELLRFAQTLILGQ